MNQDLTKTNNTSLELSKVSQNDTVKKIISGQVGEIEIPKTVKEAIDKGLPIAMVQKVTGLDGVLYTLEMMLADVIASVNVDQRLNIQKHQTQVIAQTIVDNFKHESIEDFKLAFARGSAGFYGEIYRLDGAVIVRWIQLYLEEKYSQVEQDVQEWKKSELEPVDYAAFLTRLEAERTKQNDNRQAEIDRRRKDAQDVLGGASVGYQPPDREKLLKYQLDNDYILENFNTSGTRKAKWIEKEQWLKQRVCPHNGSRIDVSDTEEVCNDCGKTMIKEK